VRPPFHSLPKCSFSRLRVLSERPPICLAPNLLTRTECRTLIAKAEASSLKQQTFDSAGGERTSSGCVLRNEEVPTLRRRFADLTGAALSQLQPLKVSRYLEGERFDVHTDAIRGDRREIPLDPEDWWDDSSRATHGVPGAPFSGCNRIITIFVYLNDVALGGRTRWRWTDHDAHEGGSVGATFYDRPRPSAARINHAGSGPEVAVTPTEGLGVLHFPATRPETGGYTDVNAYHEAEPPGRGCVKWVAQQFIWSHPRLDWTRVLDAENHEPNICRTEEVL